MYSFDDFLKDLKSGKREDFDMYRQDPDDWKDLSDAIPGLVITSAGGIMPYQAQGTLHGHPFYFRCRGEHASLRLVEVDGDAVADNPLYSAGVPTDYMIDTDGFIELMKRLVPQLKRAPFRWEFEGKKVTVDSEFTVLSSEETEISYGWGNTPEEGFIDTKQHSEYLTDKGFTTEIQNKLWAARELNPIPVNSDNRNWPAVEPVFIVKD